MQLHESSRGPQIAQDGRGSQNDIRLTRKQWVDARSERLTTIVVERAWTRCSLPLAFRCSISLCCTCEFLNVAGFPNAMLCILRVL